MSVKCESEKEQGYVKFKEVNDANKAIEALHAKKSIGDRVLFVNKHISKTDPGHDAKKTQEMKKTFESNIFIRNIPKDVAEEDFRAVMEKAGQIMSLKMKDQE